MDINNGVLIQFGYKNSGINNGGNNITLPISYNSYCIVLVTRNSNMDVTSAASYWIRSNTNKNNLTKFNLYASAGIFINYLTIGY